MPARARPREGRAAPWRVGREVRPGAVGCGANCDGGVGSACILLLLAALPRARLYYRCALSRGPNEGPGLRVRAEAGILLCYVMYLATQDIF